MKRREFILKTVGALGVGAFAGFTVAGIAPVVVKARGPFTIGDILTVAWPAVRAEHLASPERVHYAEASLSSGQPYVQRLMIPCVWSQKDEDQNRTEKQRIALVTSLLENALNSHDDLLAEKAETHAIVLDRDWSYQMTEVQQFGGPASEFHGYVVKLHSTLQMVPR